MSVRTPEGTVATEPLPAGLDAETVLEPGESELRRIRGRGRFRGIVAVLGPAFVACIAYVDPGNFATNIAAGSTYGFLLVWVLVGANLMAMLIQYLSAKLGIVTGRNLPEVCRASFPRPANRGLWVQAELVAMACDVAEIIGGALALNLLFGIGLFPAGLITAAVSFLILGLQRRGYRRFELAIVFFVVLILLGFLYNLLRVGVDPGAAAAGLVPSFEGTDSVLLAAGILGATVMPHVVYLHSALTQGRISPRDDGERRELLRFQRVDVVVALGVAGLINLSMLLIAASLFFDSPLQGTDTIEGAYAGFRELLGPEAALAFALALLASGMASSSVGTYAGQVVMQGFIGRKLPLTIRRLVTMAPALAILAVGVNPSDALVISQVVLSFGIPFALVPLVMFTSRSSLMGSFTNHRATTVAASVVAALIIALNLFLVARLLVG